MTDVTGISESSASASAAKVPERPGWMNAPIRETSSPSRRPDARTKGLVASVDEEVEPVSVKRRVIFWITSAAATGYGLSFIFHTVLLAGMGFWMLPSLVDNNAITTVVQSDTEVPNFDTLEDITLEAPAGKKEIVKPQLTEMIEQDAEVTQLQHDFLTDVTAAETEGEGGDTQGTGGGIRLLEPSNAVRKGSFSAWTIPIPQRVGEKPKAGESPRRGQAYYIVVQVQLPDQRRTYKVNDLSGKIVGTDGYQQLIPAQAYVQEKNGTLTRAGIGRRLPIIDGVVQILIQVPGAEALVKDTVSIKSRSLKEQQTLELIFGQ